MMGLVEVVGSDIRHLIGNHALERFYGLPAGALTGRLASELGDPESVVRDWVLRCRESERTGGPIRFDYVLTRPDGSHHLSATVAPAAAPPGGPPRFSTIVEDMAGCADEERARLVADLEQSLRGLTDSWEQYRILGETLPYGAWRCNARGEVEYVSQSYLDLLESTLDEIRDFGWTHRTPAEEVNPTLAKWVRCIETGEPWDSELHILGPDGRYHTVLARGLPIRNEAGEITSWVGINLDIDERKSMEQALRDSERRYRFMAEVSPQIVWTAEPDGMLDYLNGRFQELTGLDPFEALGSGWQSFVHPDEVSSMAAAWEKSIRTGEPFEAEHRVQCAHGDYRWLLTRALPLRDEGGAVEKWFGSSTDIEERKEAEEAIRESQKDLNRAQAVAHTGSWRMDLRHGGLLWSDETYRLFGIPRGTLLTYNEFLSRVHPEDRERVDRAWNAALEGAPYDIEHRINVDGATRWVHGRAEIESDAEGTMRSGFGTVQDITERKLSEQALHESEERFRNLADAMPQLVWTANPDGILDYINRRGSEFQGLRQENGRVVWEHLVHPDDLDRTSRVWAEAVRTGATYEVEHRFHRADGSYAWYLSRAISYRERDGKIVKWYGTSTDIQEQKRVEAALAEADEAKDRFVAMLAHELRNPLNNVGMALANLRISGSGHDEEQGLFLEIIGHQVTTMTSLVNDLMDVARIKQGKIRLCRKRVALSCILEDALKSARPLMDEKGHTLKVRPPMEPIWLNADPVRIGQIIGNLLNNAAKYTPPGGTVTVTVAREAEQVVMRFTDTGIGIAPKMLPRVFDLFTQADAEGQQSTGGLGLGLTLVRQLTALHGGTVEAESPGLGAGSTFTVRLPLADESPT